MDPLRGRAEQISAKTAAVMTMKTMVIMYDDLKHHQMGAQAYVIAISSPNSCRTSCKEPKKEGGPRANFNTRKY
jgi:hypothetical protein